MNIKLYNCYIRAPADTLIISEQSNWGSRLVHSFKQLQLFLMFQLFLFFLLIFNLILFSLHVFVLIIFYIKQKNIIHEMLVLLYFSHYPFI